MSELEKLLEKMEIGESKQIPGRGGWVYKFTKKEDGFDLTVRNLDDSGWEKFFTAMTENNPYGAFEVIQEISLGIVFDKIGIKGVGNALKDRLIGMLVMDESGKIIERFSPSNYKMQGKEIQMSGRELLIDGEFKGFLNAVFEADKNRIHGHVGIFQSSKKDDVQVLEMESLIELALK